MVDLLLDFKTNFPLKGDNPKIMILSESGEEFRVRFIDKKAQALINEGVCLANMGVAGDRQWYTEWLIEVYRMDGTLLKRAEFEPMFKKIFIKIDAYALGDNLAWMPYIEEFRKKHFCDVICSTFFNELFSKAYPEILFVNPNTNIDNVYAQFYIGTTKELNMSYSPVVSTDVPLQRVGSEILGLDYVEIKPKIVYQMRPNNIDGKYVCLSEWASDEKKKWQYSGGWQQVVDFLVSVGYKVVVISKEPTELTNVIDRTGDISLNERINDLIYCDFFLGVSSGLSWLAWALDKGVVMVSDVTPKWHEFQTNVLRFCKNDIQKVDYSPHNPTLPSEVIDGLVKSLKF